MVPDIPPYKGPRAFDDRPHTVHAASSSSSPSSLSNFIVVEEDETSDGEVTPRASTAAPTPTLHPATTLPIFRRRLSRDDAPNESHFLAARNLALQAHKENNQPGNPLDEARAYRIHRVSRRPVSRVPSHSSLNTDSSESLPRRVSRLSRERILDWRDAMQHKYSQPAQLGGRNRRSSTPHRIELMHPVASTITYDAIDYNNPTTRPPTSPSKRSARQGSERVKKPRMFFSGIHDRKDTPAPSTGSSGLPMRPATGRPYITAMGGGDGARKAAALHNNYISPPSPFFNPVWTEDDLDARRRRVGSLSSAADSGADLSTYGSDLSTRDREGDVNMSSDEPVQHDFVQFLPDEIALQIFEYLEADDLLKAEGVNSKWQALATDTSVWRAVFMRNYQRQVLSDPPPIQVGGIGCGLPNKPNQEWRKMYRARIELDRNWRAGAQDAGKAVYLSGHTDSVYCLQFDEEKIITGSRDRTIRVWDINTFQCLRVIGAPQHKPTLGPKVLRTVDYPSFHMATASVNGTAYGESIYHVPREWHDASILCLQYDEEILVTGSSDSDLLIWDIKTYEPIRRLKKHTGGVLDVALDSKHIVSCSKDSRIIVWDRKTFEPKGDLTGHRGPVNAVQLRGHLLVSASGDGIARLWDLNQMKLIKEFSAKERGLAAVEFSEDMKYVLAGGNDNITYKFETETGREVMQFTGHSQLVRSLWLDSANNRVVSGSYDLDLRVYDFLNGQELWRGEEWTTSWMLAAKSDYRRIVATSQDGRILIVDFGILKGPPTYRSRDGMTIENVELLRGIENDNTIKFINPWDRSKGVYGV